MKKTMIILAAVILVTASAILAFNSSRQPSKNMEGIKTTNCSYSCK